MKAKSILFLWLAALVLAVPCAYGQQRRARFSPEEFKKKLECHITCQAAFTPEEAQKFFPIYHELKSKQRSINQQVTKLKRNNFAETDTDKAYTEAIEKIGELKEESVRLENRYYKQMCKVVPAKKVFAAMKAEDSFHRNMLRGVNRNAQKPPKK